MKRMIIFIFAFSMFGMVGCSCTYNEIYHNTQTIHVYPKRDIQIMFRHEGYPKTYCNPKAEEFMVPIKRRPKEKTVVSDLNPHICPACQQEYIPPYHQNHNCPWDEKK